MKDPVDLLKYKNQPKAEKDSHSVLSKPVPQFITLPVVGTCNIDACKMTEGKLP